MISNPLPLAVKDCFGDGLAKIPLMGHRHDGNRWRNGANIISCGVVEHLDARSGDAACLRLCQMKHATTRRTGFDFAFKHINIT